MTGMSPVRDAIARACSTPAGSTLGKQCRGRIQKRRSEVKKISLRRFFVVDVTPVKATEEDPGLTNLWSGVL